MWCLYVDLGVTFVRHIVSLLLGQRKCLHISCFIPLPQRVSRRKLRRRGGPSKLHSTAETPPPPSIFAKPSNLGGSSATLGHRSWRSGQQRHRVPRPAARLPGFIEDPAWVYPRFVCVNHQSLQLSFWRYPCAINRSTSPCRTFNWLFFVNVMGLMSTC